MARVGSGIRRAAILAVLIVLAACTTIYRNHGYIPNKEDVAKVTVGESTQAEVARDVGRPTSTGLLTGGAWYYVGSKFRHYGARAPKEIERQVMVISFDEQGVVENVEYFGLERGELVVISRRVTRSSVKGLGIVRQLLSNVGNFSAGQFIDTPE
jgi:outer membrane protein assembly factor BamE (lipoprotein component of BamABCDE complex)